MKLSIIIINFNTRALLQACLQSVFEQTKSFDFEVIVVDNGSSDDSSEMLAQHFPQVRTIFNIDNRGFAAANNQGIQQAQGEFVLLLNSDTEILDRAIDKTVAFLDTHPHIGIAGCKLLNSDGSLQPSCEHFPKPRDYFFESLYLDRLFPKNKFIGHFHLTWFDYSRTIQVDQVMGAFLLIRRSVIEQIGLMDESFFFYAEESDWCWRAKQAGWQVCFFHDAQVIHHCGSSADAISAKMLVQLHESRNRFYRKHHRPGTASLARLFMMKGAFIRFFLWGFLAIFYTLSFQKNARAAAKKCRSFAVVVSWYVGLVKSEGQKRLRRISKNQ